VVKKQLRQRRDIHRYVVMSATFTVADATHSLTKRFDGKKALALPGELQAKLVA
jgi:hypothetical protein